MEQTVYVDLFFMINFSMDFLCLFLTSKILHRQLPLWRALAAAALGGVYADVALLFPLGKLLSVAADLSVCVLMCAIVFHRKKKIKSLPLYILVFTAVSMALGGFMTALFHLFNRTSLFQNAQDVQSDGISVWIFALLAIISAAITLIGGRFFTGRTAQKNAELQVTYGGRSTTLHAMTDTGNLLQEPVSGRLCIVADLDAMSALLPRELIRAARSGNPSAMEGIPPDHVKRVRLIPTHTASGEGMLLGIRAERIVVKTEKGSREVDAMIAMAELGKRADGNEALLPARLLVS